MIPNYTAGLKRLSVPEPGNSALVSVLLLYPSIAEAKELTFGPYRLSAAPDAAIETGRDTLVLISHGNGGTSLTHRETAMSLVQQGYVVALVDHPGNCRLDNSESRAEQILIRRPRQLSAVIEHLLSDVPFPFLRKVALVGHSFGGYTALALAGGQPSTPGPVSLRVLDTPTHSGVQAIVLLAPAVAWFAHPGALQELKVSTFLRYGAQDSIIPSFQMRLLEDELAKSCALDSLEVPGAGHFSFQAPFPKSMCKPGFPPASDPVGFDRKSYHQELNREIVAFLQRFCG